MNNETQEKLKNVSQKLATFRDRLEVKLNLAEKDVQDSWQAIKPALEKQIHKVDRLAQELDTKKDEAQLKAYLGMQELADRLDAVSPHIDKMVNEVTQKAQEKIDVTMLKAELAKMDAEDFYAKKKEEIAASFKDKKDQTISKIHSVFDKASHHLDELSEKMKH